MDTVAPKTNKAGRRDGSKAVRNQPKSDEKPISKGTMREPTQQPAAAGKLEDLKQALQTLEEEKGDWSKGG